MHIITLTERQFNNYSKIHSKKNYKQTVEYADALRKYGYVKLYLGLIDHNDKVVGATLILESLIKGKYKVGFAPFGYLVNYDDIDLFYLFSNEIKRYLGRLNYIFLRLESNYVLGIFDKRKNVILKNVNILDNDLYVKSFNSKEECRAILDISNIDNFYCGLSRNLKRKIQTSKIMGISGFKSNDVDLFYSLVKKKTKYNIDYFRELRDNFKDNFEIYFAKMDSGKYLNNVQDLFSKEKQNNEILQKRIGISGINNNKKVFNLKMRSDKLVNKYKNEIVNASKLYSKISKSEVLSTCAIIKMDKTIYFIEEGYNDNFRDIYSLSTLKWELIRYYYYKGYRRFDLGCVSFDKNVCGIYFSLASFNPIIYLYPGNYDLVINKYLYNLVKKIDFM